MVSVEVTYTTPVTAQALYDDLTGRLDHGLRIWTGETWALLGGPLAPAPEPPKWWHFPKAGQLFRLLVVKSTERVAINVADWRALYGSEGK